MKIFALSLIACCLGLLGGPCYADESEGVVVKTCAVAQTNIVSAFTYGIDSNQLDYLVLEIGRNVVNSQVEGSLVAQNDGNLRGVQYLKLAGMSVRLTSSHRVFVVNQQKCFTMPLTLSLKFVEQSLKDRPQEFSEELQAGINRNGTGEK